jgi:hypothetical protein
MKHLIFFYRHANLSFLPEKLRSTVDVTSDYDGVIPFEQYEVGASHIEYLVYVSHHDAARQVTLLPCICTSDEFDGAAPVIVHLQHSDSYRFLHLVQGVLHHDPALVVRNACPSERNHASFITLWAVAGRTASPFTSFAMAPAEYCWPSDAFCHRMIEKSQQPEYRDKVRQDLLQQIKDQLEARKSPSHWDLVSAMKATLGDQWPNNKEGDCIVTIPIPRRGLETELTELIAGVACRGGCFRL